MHEKYVYVLILLILLGCKNHVKTVKTTNEEFIIVRNGQFILKGKPWYFIGTNFWYGPILGSQGEFGDRQRLILELDLMKNNGINNLRVLIGVDGPDEIPCKVIPSLQKAPGKYKERLFDGLDFFMNELSKRDMYAVIYLNNTWAWSGGFAQYLNWAGYGPIPIPSDVGWADYSNYISDFFTCDTCMVMFKQHIKTVISRTNYYNGRKYTDDPYILSWQIANEPRPLGENNKKLYEKWLKETAAFIKTLDTNHLVSTGSEGWEGSEKDIDLYTHIHADSNIDYLTIHIWPKNWNWIQSGDIPGTIQYAIDQTDAYLDKHISLAKQLYKPITLEEFGFPRDNQSLTISATTIYRDQYYTHIFDRIIKSAEENGVLAGCNFWAWGGYARPQNIYWHIGDDYTGDPAQEEQGLNSVFDTDYTLNIIHKYNQRLAQ